ncbi:NAD(P)/FAD-dependent oxidoreductase [Amycolatopsis anabasis]|uniref:NAD(P)/FAD-dependent oxidoreductase n=1 Tax=Amycolatopsis anabasis TaxID=1840409 RepID=UPI00131E82BC|nr:NAD(P)/FAD-dependent oxidoreductase [Amycolatopsis anabasis]
MNDTQKYDVAIVGGGPAGLSAALVLSRARRRVVVVDAGNPRNAPAANLHGYLSRDGLSPAELLRIGRAEVRGFGGEFVEDTVLRARHDRALELAGGRVIEARRLLVTTGLTDELPDIPGVAELWGGDVHHCPYCHGWEVRDRPVGVLGSVHHALLLRQWTDDLIFFPHTGEIGDEDARRLGTTRVAPGKVERLVIENGRLAGIALADGTVVAREALFVRPVFVPKDALLGSLGCARDGDGLVTVDRTGRTSVPWVWAAGNTVDPAASIITAAGDAARAAGALNADLVEEDVTRAG